jgi:hypothetical protein
MAYNAVKDYDGTCNADQASAHIAMPRIDIRVWSSACLCTISLPASFVSGFRSMSLRMPSTASVVSRRPACSGPMEGMRRRVEAPLCLKSAGAYLTGFLAASRPLVIH